MTNWGILLLKYEILFGSDRDRLWGRMGKLIRIHDDGENNSVGNVYRMEKSLYGSLWEKGEN